MGPGLGLGLSVGLGLDLDLDHDLGLNLAQCLSLCPDLGSVTSVIVIDLVTSGSLDCVTKQQ